MKRTENELIELTKALDKDISEQGMSPELAKRDHDIVGKWIAYLEDTFPVDRNVSDVDRYTFIIHYIDKIKERIKNDG